jgi:N6-adenosine-specific RNA methylase IME4
MSNLIFPASDKKTELHFHPLAEIFPLMEGAEFEELVADVRVHNVREPVWLHQGKILDGRNRYRAAKTADVPCPTRVYEGNDPVSFVISLNLKRRHLSGSQRAMVAAKLATLSDGQRADLVEGLPIGRASELLNVGERSVARAREVRARGAPELVRAVEAGQIKVSVAADIATESLEQQQEIVAKGEREILLAAKSIRARRSEQRHAERIKRLAEISDRDTSFPTGQRYPVIYADPAWTFEVYAGVTGSERTPDAHYPCQTTEAICALPVKDLATDDAVLFIWVTCPHLQQAFDVIQAWGFQYATNIAWMKDKTGLGFWVRNQHELLLIAKRGDMPAPAPSRRPPSIINASRREHSRKPDEAYGLIERMYPTLPKIELFARHARPGWAQWGNQAPGAIAGDAA